MKRLAIGTLFFGLALAACGGGGDGGQPPNARGTPAYVETECRDTKEGFVERQALRIRPPNGAQIFAIQPDGSALRQLTDSRGLVQEADGTYSAELPGPSAYGPCLPS